MRLDLTAAEALALHDLLRQHVVRSALETLFEDDGSAEPKFHPLEPLKGRLRLAIELAIEARDSAPAMEAWMKAQEEKIEALKAGVGRAVKAVTPAAYT